MLILRRESTADQIKKEHAAARQRLAQADADVAAAERAAAAAAPELQRQRTSLTAEHALLVKALKAATAKFMDDKEWLTAARSSFNKNETKLQELEADATRLGATLRAAAGKGTKRRRICTAPTCVVEEIE